MESADLKDKALEIHRRLCRAYGCPIAYFHALDPVSELVSSLLSHRTRNRDSGRAFKALRARFPDWPAVAAAPTAEVEAAIAGVTWPEQKAPRIQAVLRAIEATRGELSLDFLADLPVEEARAWLEHLPGIGPKTSAAVLSFSVLRRPALPVDSHHHRVAARTGLIPASLPVGPSHRVLAAQLPPEWDAQQVYDNHEVLMLHGQRCCFFRKPACARCVLLDLCPTGRANMHHAPPGALTDTRTHTPDDAPPQSPPRAHPESPPHAPPHARESAPAAPGVAAAPGQVPPHAREGTPAAATHAGDVAVPRAREGTAGAAEGDPAQTPA